MGVPPMGLVLASSWAGSLSRVLGPYLSPGSGPPGEETQNALLEHLVSDRGHMVATGNLERPARRQQVRQFRRGAADRILGAERNQRRDPNPGDLRAREGLARPAHAGRERPQVGLGLLGKN